MAKLFAISRIDTHPRLIFIAGVRFDPAGNVISADEYKLLKDRKDFRQYLKADVFKVQELDTDNKAQIKKALCKIESKVAREKANDLLSQFEDDTDDTDENSDDDINDRDGDGLDDIVTKSYDGGEDLLGFTFSELRSVVEDEKLDCSIQSNWAIDTNAKKIAEARNAKAE